METQAQRGIWSACFATGGGDGQTITDEGTVTEEKSFWVDSWAHMRVDYARNNENFAVRICMKKLQSVLLEEGETKCDFAHLTAFDFAAVYRVRWLLQWRCYEVAHIV